MKSVNILLVEDDESCAYVISEFLRQAGHTVDVAGNFHTGKAMLLAGSYEVLLADVGLPDGSGLQLIPHARTARIIITTGHANMSLLNWAWPGLTCLSKPFTTEELLASVTDAKVIE
jgi:DNA-binding response OmpR family regulator